MSASTGMSPLARAVVFGLEIGILAAVITAIVIYIKNDKDKNKVGYKPINLWKNVAIAGGIGGLGGFVLSELKHRFQEKKAVQAAGAAMSSAVSAASAKWRAPASTSLPSVST